MKKVALFLIIFAGVMFVINQPEIRQMKNRKLSKTQSSNTTKIDEQNPITRSSTVFVPYWTLKSSSTFDSTTNTLIYFAVSPEETGILASDAGYNQLSTFQNTSKTFQGKKLLALKMTDEKVSSVILENSAVQKKLVGEVVDLLNSYSFDGLVLDLEYTVLPTKEVIANVTKFVKNISAEVTSHKKTFGMTLYGDTLYRQRPYDLKALEQSTSHFYIMAYDFHRSYGEPGPNFPLNKGKTYGYDIKTMSKDISSLVGAEKMTVIFGMYGYDWMVDDQNRPLKAAKAYSLAQIKNKKLDTKHDPVSSESTIDYKDGTGQRHVMWFEDEASIQAKTEYLHSVGIGSIGYWAYGYY